MSIEEELREIRDMVSMLLQQSVKDYYEIEEFARLVDRAPYTCREWARLGRVHARKKLSGRGAYARWVVENSELQRYRREGLLPLVKIGTRG